MLLKTYKYYLNCYFSL